MRFTSYDLLKNVIYHKFKCLHTFLKIALESLILKHFTWKTIWVEMKTRWILWRTNIQQKPMRSWLKWVLGTTKFHVPFNYLPLLWQSTTSFIAPGQFYCWLSEPHGDARGQPRQIKEKSKDSEFFAFLLSCVTFHLLKLLIFLLIDFSHLE